MCLARSEIAFQSKADHP